MGNRASSRPSFEGLVNPVFPESPAMADVAIAIFMEMQKAGLAEAKAKCPFCPDGYLHAGRVGNARRARVQCDDCGRNITQSFRDAMGLV
jgi:transposase-like protein